MNETTVLINMVIFSGRWCGVHEDWTWANWWIIPDIHLWSEWGDWCKRGQGPSFTKVSTDGAWKWGEFFYTQTLLEYTWLLNSGYIYLVLIPKLLVCSWLKWTFSVDSFGTALSLLSTVPDLPYTVHASNPCWWLAVPTAAHGRVSFLHTLKVFIWLAFESSMYWYFSTSSVHLLFVHTVLTLINTNLLFNTKIYLTVYKIHTLRFRLWQYYYQYRKESHHVMGLR
jgi:hypothetical protein